MNAEQLLQGLGQSVGLGASLRFNQNGCARLMVDSTLALDFEHVPGMESMQMFCVVGDVPAQGREEFYQELLAANLFGAETGGSVLAVDKISHQVVLSQMIELDHMSVAHLVRLAERLVNAAEDWVARIARFAPSTEQSAARTADMAAGTEELPFAAPRMGAMMRV